MLSSRNKELSKTIDNYNYVREHFIHLRKDHLKDQTKVSPLYRLVTAAHVISNERYGSDLHPCEREDNFDFVERLIQTRAAVNEMTKGEASGLFLDLCYVHHNILDALYLLQNYSFFDISFLRENVSLATLSTFDGVQGCQVEERAKDDFVRHFCDLSLVFDDEEIPTIFLDPDVNMSRKEMLEKMGGKIVSLSHPSIFKKIKLKNP